ncbi:MAG: hypothetical protein JW762_07480 [Dehalococcoidales bacterium]|nr:hypothetical protein [Dehalococcoidales bacterium]
MVLHIGDRVIYEDGGEPLTGEIVDIWKNNQERITGYFVILDSGIYVQFLPDNLKWSKLEEPVLIA